LSKTYNPLSNVTVGSVLTASDYNKAVENSNNFRVPPSVMVRRTTNLTSYTSDTAIAWQSVGSTDTDPTMWTVSDATKITINTAGLYLVAFTGTATGTATISTAIPGILVNASFVASSTTAIFSGTTARWALALVLNLSAGNALTASVGFSGGSAYVVSGNASLASDQTRLSATWLGLTS
jgi:hypothetical protein